MIDEIPVEAAGAADSGLVMLATELTAGAVLSGNGPGVAVGMRVNGITGGNNVAAVARKTKAPARVLERQEGRSLSKDADLFLLLPGLVPSADVVSTPVPRRRVGLAKLVVIEVRGGDIGARICFRCTTIGAVGTTSSRRSLSGVQVRV